jgi:hypothetical protein
MASTDDRLTTAPRRKYRKMRVKFDEAITVSNRLITDEWKAMGTARRLAEGNDQLLDMLLDINEQTRAPARLRFNLDPPGTAPVVPGPEPAAIQQQLHELREAAASGAISQEEYIARAEPLHNSHAIRQTLKSLAALEARVPHTTRGDLPDRPLDGIDLTEHAPGYLSPAHEEEYLAALDQVLAEPGFDPANQEGRPIRHAASHPPLSEKDLTVRNPDSVYNWLRKHQPQVFLQDKDAAPHENMSEKSAPPKANASNRKSIKRESAVGGTPGPRDPDDEDSVAGETGGKGRRKTTGGADGDDTAYRPKGGSSRPAKRKREEGDTPAPKSKKKSRASTAATGA